MLTKGDVLNEQYLIEERIGSGGYGTVYRAHDRKENRVVAIKVLRSDLADDPDYRRRFRREADIARLLTSDRVVKILETGSSRMGDDEIDFQVMEFVEGGTLHERLREGPVPMRRALYIAAQIAEALEEAELRGIVHCDVKPKNIFVGKGEFARLGDFGIARATGFPSLEPDDPILGTPRYMSPEQALGKIDEVDARSDIYSLGVVLYEMIAGKPPFEGDRPSVVAYWHANEQAKPLRSFAKNVPDSVDQLVRRCMAKRLYDRYRTASELREAIWSAIEGVTAAGDTPITPLGGMPGRLPLGLRVRRILRVPLLRRALRSMRGTRLAAVAAAPLAAVIAFGVLIAMESAGDKSTANDIPTSTVAPTVLTRFVPPTQAACWKNSPGGTVSELPDTPVTPIGPSDGEVVSSHPQFCWEAHATGDDCFVLQLNTRPPSDDQFAWWYEMALVPDELHFGARPDSWSLDWGGEYPAKGPVLAPGNYYWRVLTAPQQDGICHVSATSSASSPVFKFRVADPWQDALAGQIQALENSSYYLTQLTTIDSSDSQYAVAVYTPFKRGSPSSTPFADEPRRDALDEGKADRLVIYQHAATITTVRTDDGPGQIQLAPVPTPEDINEDGLPDLVVRYNAATNCMACSPVKIFSFAPDAAKEISIQSPHVGMVPSRDDAAQPQSSGPDFRAPVLPWKVLDVDVDGVYEVVAIDLSWVLHGFCHVCSPTALFVLAWDSDAEAYLDASPRFTGFFDEEIQKLYGRQSTATPSTDLCSSDENIVSYAFAMVLLYGRSGRGSLGWDRYADIGVASKLRTDYWRAVLPQYEADLRLSVPVDGSLPSTDVPGSSLPKAYSVCA